MPRRSLLSKTVYACDEMSGFVIAIPNVSPNRSLDEVNTAAVRWNMRDRSFARQVTRDQPEMGVDALGVPVDEHATSLLAGLTMVRGELGP